MKGRCGLGSGLDVVGSKINTRVSTFEEISVEEQRQTT